MEYLTLEKNGHQHIGMSYSLFIGEIPDSMMVLHSCDNPCCVNPLHLKTGTHLDNMMDRKRAGRYISAQRKLTNTQVIEIYQSKESGPVLASRYGVTRYAIDRIRSGQTYRDLTNGAKSPGWRGRNGRLDSNAKRYRIIPPDGDSMEISNLRQWCIKNQDIFAVNETKMKASDKIMCGLTGPSGYQGWRAERIE